jgi:hypothetical protein
MSYFQSISIKYPIKNSGNPLKFSLYSNAHRTSERLTYNTIISRPMYKWGALSAKEAVIVSESGRQKRIK